MISSALPDLDVVGMALGVPYASPFGHRGFSHSIVFAVVLGWLAVEILFPAVKRFFRDWWVLGFCFVLATASHEFLDAFTNGGLGVDFFWPFDNTRYFFPWRPIAVSPLGVSRFFQGRALGIILNELLWVWLPVSASYLVFKVVRKTMDKR